MTFLTRDGSVVSGITAEDVVTVLRQQSRRGTEDNAEWMKGCAARVAMQSGEAVDGTDAEKFLSGLIDVGLLMPVVPN